jgi:hypothetical protein
MIGWIIAIAFVALLIWYALAGRRWLRSTALGARFLDWIEPVEIVLFKKSETLLIGRLTWLGAGIVSAYDLLAVFASSLDLTPITTRLLYFIPDDLRGVVVSAGIAALGLMISWLRKRTAKPVELVAAPTTPETIAVEAKVEAANAEAVAVVEAVKAA